MSMINKTKEKKLKRKIEYLSSKLHWPMVGIIESVCIILENVNKGII